MIAALLDTDTVSLINRRDPQVTLNSIAYTRRFGQLNFSEFSYYEVVRGYKATAATAKLARFEQFCRRHRIINFSHQAAIIAADIWADLKQRGVLIGEMDVLIAGVALSEGLAVATHNTAHFSRIAGLQVVDWTV